MKLFVNVERLLNKPASERKIIMLFIEKQKLWETLIIAKNTKLRFTHIDIPK